MQFYIVCVRLRRLLVSIHQTSASSAGIIRLAATKHNYSHIYLPRALHAQVAQLIVCVCFTSEIRLTARGEGGGGKAGLLSNMLDSQADCVVDASAVT